MGWQIDLSHALTYIASLVAIFGLIGWWWEARRATWRIAAQRTLAESGAQLQSVLDNMPAAIVLKDREHRYLTLNRQYETWFGVTAAQQLGRRLRDVGTDPQFAAEIERVEDEVLASGEARTFESHQPDTPSAPTWELVTKFPVRHIDGTIVGVGTVIVDIGEKHAADLQRRQLEQQLHHSQKVESLGTLAGGIAHELNNTLVPILAVAKLRLNRAAPHSDERTALELIYRGSLRARDLVKQILAFARNEVQEQRLFRLEEVLSEAVSMVRAIAPAMIRVELAAAPVPPILGDPTQIHQVLVNLMNNAVQAIGMQHGTVSISLEPVAGATPAEPGLVRLAVADSGCGMDEATQQRIFDPFFTTKAVGEGTGLGLSVVHGIVSTHGGTIRVESAPGRGARFIIDLPCASRAEDNTERNESVVA